MRDFDPRTATQAEFEAEARRLHAERLERIQNMTPEEQQACARFMMDGLLQRYATLHLNQLVPVETVDINIAKCVEIWRTDNWQSSEEYQAERERLVAADRARKLAEASERARQEAARRNARARWIAQGNDPAALALDPAPEADIVVDVPDQSLHDVIVSAAKEHLNKGEWAGTLRIVGPGGDQRFDADGNEIEAGTETGQGTDPLDAIVAAIGRLAPHDFNDKGRPRVKALRRATGLHVTLRQRNEAWRRVRSAKPT